MTYDFENSKIKLDVGGQHFTTTKTTITRFPASIIGAMFSGRHVIPCQKMIRELSLLIVTEHTFDRFCICYPLFFCS
jgi:hypothetical protein